MSEIYLWMWKKNSKKYAQPPHICLLTIFYFYYVLKRCEYQTTFPVSWEICMQVKKQQLEPDMEQTGSKLGKEYIKAVYRYPAYETYI